MERKLWAWSEKGTLTSRGTESREVLKSWFPSAFPAASHQAFIKTLTHSTGTLITVECTTGFVISGGQEPPKRGVAETQRTNH